ncbi:MAG: flagellar hook-associated protein FlgK [Xanthobacteraceae bacterium]
MSLTSALNIAMTGLTANQAALSIVSSNVANAQTAGYVSLTPTQVSVGDGSSGVGVEVTGVNRQLNQYLQSQLRTETSGAAYADQMSTVLQQLQSVYGTPGGTSTLETAYNNFTSSLQALSTSAGSASQSAAVTAAQSLAQQLNTTTQGIQALRTNAEQDIGTSVKTANSLMSQIAQINGQLQGMNATDTAAATLMDQRDSDITQLSQLMDVNVVNGSNNQATVYTTSGVQLVNDSQASTMTFNAQGSLNATSQWNSNPAKSSVGSLTISLPNGANIDMIANKSITSGQIAADLNLRDNVLVQAQTQVDQLAATLSSSVSDTTTAGTAVTSGTQAGFTVDTSNMLAGNSISLSYANTATGTPQQVTLVNVTDSTALPLPASMSSAGNTVIGVNFSAGMASVVTQLNAALGPAGLQFSNPSGSTLQVLNSSAAVTVNSASVTTTATATANGNSQLALFTDGTSPYTGAITSSGSQLTGFAGRITVNPAVVSNPALVTNYSASTTSGDTTRSDYLYSQLTSGSYTYSPQTGLGSSSSPYSGTISNYMQQFLSQQADAASSAQQLQQGQDVVLNTLQQSVSSSSGVNMDSQMSNLISLQNAYAANAHVMAVVQSMMTSLIQIPV